MEVATKPQWEGGRDADGPPFCHSCARRVCLLCGRGGVIFFVADGRIATVPQECSVVVVVRLLRPPGSSPQYEPASSSRSSRMGFGGCVGVAWSDVVDGVHSILVSPWISTNNPILAWHCTPHCRIQTFPMDVRFATLGQCHQRRLVARLSSTDGTEIGSSYLVVGWYLRQNWTSFFHHWARIVARRICNSIATIAGWCPTSIIDRNCCHY